MWSMEMIHVTQERWKKLGVFNLEKEKLQKLLQLFSSRRTEAWSKETTCSVFLWGKKRSLSFVEGGV